MKTKITLAIVALSTIIYSCSERSDEQEVSLEKKQTINYKKELKVSSSNPRKVSDTLKNGNILHGTTNSQNMGENQDDSETVNPGQLGTPPTRP